MTTQNFIPYALHYIDNDDIHAVATTLSHGSLTRGPAVLKFEEEIAQYCGAAHAVAFTNGSAALSGAYYAAQITPYDKVITTPNTFAATATMSVRCGGPLPTFVDIDETTGNISTAASADAIARPLSRGKHIIVPVHFAGIPVDMRRLSQSMRSPDDIIIEDGSHAFGSYHYHGGPRIGSCTYSSMTVFSFHASKTITSGEGGMVTTNDPAIAERLRLFRNNGIIKDAADTRGPWYYEVRDATGNYHMTDMQAALGLSQFKKIELFIEKRQRLLAQYCEELKGTKHLSILDYPTNNTVTPHIFVVKIDFDKCGITRKAVMKALLSEGIGTQVLYIPLYHHPYFKEHLGDIAAQFPATERYYAQTLALPLHYNLEKDDISRICSVLKEILDQR